MFGLSRQIFIEVPRIKSHTKLIRGSRAVTCRQTDMNLVAAKHKKTVCFETNNDRRLLPTRKEEIMKKKIIIVPCV